MNGCIAWALQGFTGGASASQPGWLEYTLAAFALLAVLLGGWKVAGALSDPTDPDSDLWEKPAMTGQPPEYTEGTEPLSGTELSSVIERGGEQAREAGRIEAGLTVVRPILRETLVDVLAAGDHDQEEAAAAVSNGDWTDNQVAAAVLSESVSSPQSVAGRLRGWLFPERELRRRVEVAVSEMASAAGSSLPTVPGQRAPRPVPTRQPRLEALNRAADGNLSPVTEPLLGDASDESAAEESR